MSIEAIYSLIAAFVVILVVVIVVLYVSDSIDGVIGLLLLAAVCVAFGWWLKNGPASEYKQENGREVISEW